MDTPSSGKSADVGENERLYRAAREAEERARLQAVHVDMLFRQAPAIIAVLRGLEHVFELASRRYLEVVGRDEETLIGKAIRDALPELEGQGHYELCDRVYATGQPFVGSDLSNGSGYPLALKRALPGSMR